MYWNPKKTLSYNAIYNVILGNRGGGKTVGSLSYVVEKYLKTRNTNEPFEFFYLRRFQEELRELTRMRNGKIFDDIERLGFFHEVNLKAEGNIMYCDNKAFGIAMALTDAPTKKSIPFPNVKLGIFEEFIIDKGVRHYLPNEVESFLDLDQTIDRDRDQLKWLMLANAVSSSNPYMDYWDLDIPWGKTRQLYGNDNQILIELVQDEDFIAKKKSTRRGQLMEGTRYGDYAIENKMLRDNANFIAKKTKTCEYKFTLLYYENQIGVWYDVRNGKFYLSLSVDLQYPITFAATTEDMQPNVMLLKGAKRSPYIQRLMDAYKKGCVYFENGKIKSWFRDIVRMGL